MWARVHVRGGTRRDAACLREVHAHVRGVRAHARACIGAPWLAGGRAGVDYVRAELVIVGMHVCVHTWYCVHVRLRAAQRSAAQRSAQGTCVECSHAHLMRLGRQPPLYLEPRSMYAHARMCACVRARTLKHTRPFSSVLRHCVTPSLSSASPQSCKELCTCV